MYEGRGWDRVGAHVRGYNSLSIGIAFIGTFTNRKPNTAALNTAKQLIRCGVSQVSFRRSFVYITPGDFLLIRLESGYIVVCEMHMPSVNINLSTICVRYIGRHCTYVQKTC